MQDIWTHNLYEGWERGPSVQPGGRPHVHPGRGHQAEQEALL